MRIAHISDLHICNAELRPHVERVAAAASDELGVNVTLSIATDDSLQSLIRALNHPDLNPDVICITGDFTTCGDRGSFQSAATYVRQLANRGVGKPRPIVVTPGNHDVLCSHLSAVLSRNGLIYQYLKRVKFPKTTKAIRVLLKQPHVLPQQDIMHNYRQFLDSSKPFGVHSSATELDRIGNTPIWCVPFNTVSIDPLWMNVGRTDRREFANYYNELRAIGVSDSILIALVHHNPISAPDALENPLVYAYNSMPGASLMVREMQNAGTDLVLYGHQHAQASCIIDFMPPKYSQVNLLGAASATCGSNPGFNIIEIDDRFHARVAAVSFNPAGGFSIPTDSDYRSLIFDTDRPDDPLTMYTKNEIRYFRYLDAEGQEAQWNSMHTPGARDILIVGPRLKRVMKERREELLRIVKHTNNETLRILLSDPSLYQRIEKLNADDRAYLRGMWGERISWEDQAHDAQLTLEALNGFREFLPASVKSKLEVRLSHTLLPIGAIARDSNEPNGSMLIRLLPVGIMGGAVKRPVLRLTRRHPAAVYSFYHAYLGELWRSGLVVNN